MTVRARRLRKRPTDAEQRLWRALRRQQIGGMAFRRQHPVGSYVLDFYCPDIGLGIEVDGGQHNEDARAYDERRERWLASRGIAMIRFWNNEVLTNLDGVLTEIVRKIDERRVRHATPSLTLPLSGGGKSTGAR